MENRIGAIMDSFEISMPIESTVYFYLKCFLSCELWKEAGRIFQGNQKITKHTNILDLER